MPMLDMLIENVEKHGWMSISSLFFDNAYNVFIPTTCGYIAYSKEHECFVSLNSMDSTDTDIVENTYVTMDPGFIGQQQVLTIIGQEHLQHFNMAMYAQYRFWPYTDKELPYPTYPTEGELSALVKDEETGLYNGCDVITTMANEKRSTLDLYKDTLDYRKGDPYSGANIDAWKNFYVNHNHFKTFLSKFMGITDAI